MSVRNALVSVIIMATAALLVGFMVGKTQHTAPATSQVTSFNDGFSDSKADDCQQGFASACAWMNGGK